MRNNYPRTILLNSLLAILVPVSAIAGDRLFYLRYVPALKTKMNELTMDVDGGSYKQIFGFGDKNSDSLNGVMHFGELTVEPGGRSAIVNYPHEEQIYFVLKGSGTLP